MGAVSTEYTPFSHSGLTGSLSALALTISIAYLLEVKLPNHLNYKKHSSHLSLVVSSHADSLGFIYPDFEISVYEISVTTPIPRRYFHFEKSHKKCNSSIFCRMSGPKIIHKHHCNFTETTFCWRNSPYENCWQLFCWSAALDLLKNSNYLCG